MASLSPDDPIAEPNRSVSAATTTAGFVRPPSRWRGAAPSAGALLAYLVAVGLCGRLLGAEAAVVAWPPTGVLLAIAIVAARLRAPLGFLAIAVGLSIGLATLGIPPAPALVVALGTSAIHILGALLLHRTRFDPGLSERRDLGLFLAAAISVPLATSTLVALVHSSGLSLSAAATRDGSVSDWLIQPELVNRSFVESWIGDATGILVMTPVLLLLTSWLREQMFETGYLEPTEHDRWSEPWPEAPDSQLGAQLSSFLVLVLAGLVFYRAVPVDIPIASLRDGLEALPVQADTFLSGTLALLLMLPILWTATRLRPLATSLFASVLCLSAMAATAAGRGPFDGPFTPLGPLWAYIVAVCSICLLLSLVLRGERRAYAMARANRELLERIVDHVPANISVRNDRGRFVFMNQRLADFLAVDSKHSHSRNDEPSEDLELLPEQLARLRPASVEQTDELAMESGRLRMYEEVRLEAADGDWHEFLQTRVPMLADSRRHELLTIQLDITDRKQAERALKESEAKLRSLMDNLAGWILLMDLEGTIEWTNRGFQGIEARRFIGTKTSDWITEESFERGLALRDQVITSGLAATYEVELDEPLEGWLSIVLSPVIEDDEVVSLMMLITDVTELKREAREIRRLEDQMEQVRHIESLGALAGSVAHDFNNLLVGMLGNADYLMRRTDPETTDGRAARRILKACEKARDLCDQLLDYAGHSSLRSERLDLNQLILETLPVLEGRLSVHARIRVDLDSDLPPLEGEETQLTRVLMNLLANASDALGDQQGDILVTTRRRSGRPAQILLSVKDTGCGMSQETRGRIFDPFFSTKLQGRGLGLAACQGIVRRHGGSIRLDSREGEGTVFEILLPAADSTDTPAEIPGRTPGPSCKILIIEDDEGVTKVAREALEAAGFDVLTAEDGYRGIEMFDAHRPDVAAIVLDLTMPGMTGDQVLVEVRALEPDVPVLISSGFASGPIARRVEGESGVAFLPKPYRPEELSGAVLRLLSLSSADSRIE